MVINSKDFKNNIADKCLRPTAKYIAKNEDGT